MVPSVLLVVAVAAVLPAIAADMTQKQCVQGWNGDDMSTTQTWDSPKTRDNRIDQLAMCNQVRERGRGWAAQAGAGPSRVMPGCRAGRGGSRLVVVPCVCGVDFSACVCFVRVWR